ncbi:MAG TPA: hypothetical protein VFY05_07835 [Candidatus Angelobacter sp.]|nr:hypothetical protein [Candidatus Angelobacter sp.]
MLTFWFDRSAAFPARLCMGTVIGLAIASMAGYLLACEFGLGAACMWTTVLVLLLPGLLLLQPEFRRQTGDAYTRALHTMAASLGKPSRSTLGFIVFYVALAAMLGTLFSFSVYRDADGIYTGVTNNLGDLTLHLQVINSFVHSRNFPPQDPTFAGVRFAYPFLCDVLTAMLVKAGAGMITAMWLQGVVLALALAGLMHYWTLLLTRSHLAGVIAVVLVFFSGGLGWSWMFLDLHNSEHGLIPLLGHLTHDYTINLDGLFRWGNSLTTLFIPQRSILFGVPLAIVIFCQWWKVVTSRENTHRDSQNRMLAAGILAGMLPLIHAHSYLVVMCMGACMALIFRRTWRAWVWFVVPAILIALPQALWLSGSGTIHARDYIGWRFGWDHGSLNVAQFWILNLGFFLFALAMALLWRDSEFATPRPVVKYYLPFLLCFIVPNVISLAPWIWDNIKVLFYWYLASAPLVALLLAKGLRHKTVWRWITAGALAGMLLAGGLDILRVITGASPNREFTNSDIAAAKAVLRHTQPGAVILNAPTWDSAVYLTGRLSLLGYPGWLGSRGLDYAQRKADIQQIYAGGARAEALLKQYHIQYVVIGPPELASLPVNEQFWQQQKEVAQAGGYRLYRTGTETERAGE